MRACSACSRASAIAGDSARGAQLEVGEQHRDGGERERELAQQRARRLGGTIRSIRTKPTIADDDRDRGDRR